MNKWLIFISIFLLFSITVVAQNWLYNNTDWVYKFENIESMAVAKQCVDGKLDTYTRNDWKKNDDDWHVPASIFFDLKNARFFKNFKINCVDEFPYYTLDEFQLFAAQTPDGPWIKVLNEKMPEKYEVKAKWFEFSFEPQLARYWKFTFTPRNKAVAIFEIGFGSSGVPYSVSVPDTTILVDQVIQIPVLTSKVNTKNNVLSYQMQVNYDPTMLDFIDYTLDGTIAKGGFASINNTIPGAVVVSYMTTTPLNGEGAIIKLNFSPIQLGKSDINIQSCIYNVDSILNLKKGSLFLKGSYGDVDLNDKVQAFDAAAVLQYSVGLDPLDFDPVPWENWRNVLANVDGKEEITANDAALILRYASGTISSFPIESIQQEEEAVADVEVVQENNELVFITSGSLSGLNIKMKSLNGIQLGSPVFTDENLLTSINISSESYSVGVCSATPLPFKSTVLKIPFSFTGTKNASAEIEMNVNRNSKARVLIFIIKH